MLSGKKQTQAASHIREILITRGFDVPSRRMTLPDNQQWVVLERNERQVAIDGVSGIWLRTSCHDDWRCVAMPHTMSGALMAVDFLIQD
jgi:hypothetical protein